MLHFCTAPIGAPPRDPINPGAPLFVVSHRRSAGRMYLASPMRNGGRRGHTGWRVIECTPARFDSPLGCLPCPSRSTAGPMRRLAGSSGSAPRSSMDRFRAGRAWTAQTGGLEQSSTYARRPHAPQLGAKSSGGTTAYRLRTRARQLGARLARHREFVAHSPHSSGITPNRRVVPSGKIILANLCASFGACRLHP